MADFQEFTKPIKITNPTSQVDGMEGPYNSISEALTEIVPALREGARQFKVWNSDGTYKTYHWPNRNALGDSDIEEKTTAVAPDTNTDYTIISLVPFETEGTFALGNQQVVGDASTSNAIKYEYNGITHEITDKVELPTSVNTDLYKRMDAIVLTPNGGVELIEGQEIDASGLDSQLLSPTIPQDRYLLNYVIWDASGGSVQEPKTRLSQFINDGDGTSPYITTHEVASKIESLIDDNRVDPYSTWSSAKIALMQELDYGTIAEMLLGQGTQLENQTIKVDDASADTNLIFPTGANKVAYYKYNGTATGNLVSDYTLVSAPYAIVKIKENGAIFENQSTLGVVELNYKDWSMAILFLTGPTTFLNGIMPDLGKSWVKDILIAGDHPWSPAEGWLPDPANDSYDGTKWNRIVLQGYNSKNFGTKIRFSLENLEDYVENIDVIAEIGQSNMEGRDGDLANPNYPFDSANGFFWDGASITNITTTRGGAVRGSHANYFCEKYFQLTGRKAIMVEASKGGAGLTPTSKADPDNWSSTGSLRTTAENLINGALSETKNAIPKAGLWCQGERDAIAMTDDPAYTKPIVKNAMIDVINWWKSNYPNSPFIISELGDDNIGSNEIGWIAMREIQNELANEIEGVYIGFYGAKNFWSEGKMYDQVHYNYIGYKEMGEALATCLSEI